MSILVDLVSQVRRQLGIVNGGTGNVRGWSGGVIKHCVNRTGSSLAVGTVVRLLGTWNDSRVTPTNTASDARVLGVVVGYFRNADDQLIEDDVPDGSHAAVMTHGTVPVLVNAAVTRGQYAYTTTTSGQAGSSATLGGGAFGIFQESTSGSGSARVVLGSFPQAGTSTSFGTPAVVLGTAAAAGAASTALRTDATIVAFDATVPAAIGTAATGAAAVAARRDHVHAAALDNLSDVTITGAADDDELVYSSSTWVNRQRSAASNIWRPLMDGAVPGTIILDGATGEAIMAYGPA